ncbi:hypothetical protein Daus18300_005581 [Diaporthe australafricana]|uniref:Peptidase metallopeptidase domain-containing protein n=1 Tax=Diaporthe australafricana TaxID=127596 RepID=A0ABR3X0N9_9PEZI
MEYTSTFLVTPFVGPSIWDLEKGHTKKRDPTGSTGRKGTFSDTTESIVSLRNVSEITKPSEASTVSDDDGADGTLCRDLMLGPGCGEQDPELQKLQLPSPTYIEKEFMGRDACVISNDGLSFRGGEVMGAALGSTRLGTNKDPPVIKLEQSVGPGRYNHEPGPGDEWQVPSADQLNDTPFNIVHVPWKHPEQSNIEVRKAIQHVESLVGFQHLPSRSSARGVKASSDGAKIVPGSLSVAMNNLMPVSHFCTTENKTPLSEEYWQSSTSPADTVRQTRLHETHGVIHRLMPPGHIIYFGLDTDSFKRQGITQVVIDRIREAALEVVRVFSCQYLGLTFAYTPGPGPKFFNIRYDLSLPNGTLAQTFLPSDARSKWQLRISRRVVLSGAGRNGLLDYLPNILAHEFAHILGLRHWDAGLDARGLQEPSMLWPGTYDGNRVSIMNTGVHPRQLGFSEEDFRVIREVYSAANGTSVLGNRMILDVNPYD